MSVETKIKKQDVTREKLLMSAFCEIHRNGYQGASITSILESTELTKGALYHHFATKHALGLAVINEVVAQNLNKLVFERLHSSVTPVDTLLEIILHIDAEIGDEVILLGCPLNNLMQEMSPLDEQFRHHLNIILEDWQLAIQSALRQGQSQGQIKPEIDCQAAALFIISAWEGCIGIAKNRQSVSSFKTCMQQLHGYVRSLMIL
ncbi:MAG: TetR family transcriptional regulator C-terminal domain-containing protein [Sulfuriferula sp.]